MHLLEAGMHEKSYLSQILMDFASIWVILKLSLRPFRTLALRPRSWSWSRDRDRGPSSGPWTDYDWLIATRVRRARAWSPRLEIFPHLEECFRAFEEFFAHNTRRRGITSPLSFSSRDGGGVEEGPFGAVRAASFILRFVVRKGNQRGGDQSGISQWNREEAGQCQY